MSNDEFVLKSYMIRIVASTDWTDEQAMTWLRINSIAFEASLDVMVKEYLASRPDVHILIGS